MPANSEESRSRLPSALTPPENRPAPAPLLPYFDTLSCTGFNNVDPLSNNTDSPTFTISKGKTGTATLDVPPESQEYSNKSITANFSAYLPDEPPKDFTSGLKELHK
ncbi:hypothetical protein MUO79_11660 [Candidatus Bathyarchaeota archaeon]|nr:hypothetical protein [Candidatus Bathyarchaeota archaeon]